MSIETHSSQHISRQFTNAKIASKKAKVYAYVQKSMPLLSSMPNLDSHAYAYAKSLL